MDKNRLISVRKLLDAISKMNNYQRAMLEAFANGLLSMKGGKDE